jgi:hypothetical protein
MGTRVTRLTQVLIGSDSDFVRIGSTPFHEISPKSVRIGSNVSVFLDTVTWVQKPSPMFPLSLRLVLTSHYTITFASIVQSYSSILLVSRANIMVLQSKITIVFLLSAANFFQVTSLPLPAPYPQ